MTIIFRMSEAGACIRALSAQYLGMQPEERPAFLETAAEEGKWHEQRVRDKLRSDGYDVEECRECPICKANGLKREGIHAELKFNNFTLVGHLDGKVNHNNLKGKHLLEIKSKSQYEFDRWMRGQFNEYPEEADQIACYMAASEEKRTMFIVKNRNSGYPDINFYAQDEIAFGDWAFTERFISIVDKFDVLVAHINKKELVPAECDMSTLQCRRCFYKYLCIKPAAELTAQENAVLHTAAEHWRRGKALEAESKEKETQMTTETVERNFVICNCANKKGFFCKNWNGKGSDAVRTEEIRSCKEDPDKCPFLVETKKREGCDWVWKTTCGQPADEASLAPEPVKQQTVKKAVKPAPAKKDRKVCADCDQFASFVIDGYRPIYLCVSCADLARADGQEVREMTEEEINA